jgi:hypothetical protein
MIFRPGTNLAMTGLETAAELETFARRLRPTHYQ